MNEVEEIKQILEEYVGFPPEEVPRWVDFDLAAQAIYDREKSMMNPKSVPAPS